MEKKLPKVFVNQITKPINNNLTVAYGDKEVKTNKTEFKSSRLQEGISMAEIKRKINNIFSSPNYIYKADVDILLKSGTIRKRIVGRNEHHLIGIDNELIPISEIKNIDFSK